jgi:uncharacterized protein
MIQSGDCLGCCLVDRYLRGPDGQVPKGRSFWQSSSSSESRNGEERTGGGCEAESMLQILFRSLTFLHMALARILVDGYSLLHGWPELAPGQPRHSAAAREELLRVLTHYRDADGTPISVIFDGSGAPTGTPKTVSTPELEVLYSKAGQTADDVIERVAHRLLAFGEVLVVTDDYAERDTVLSLGGMVASCSNFIQMIQDVLTGLQRDLKRHNLKERERFRRSRTK